MPSRTPRTPSYASEWDEVRSGPWGGVVVGGGGVWKKGGGLGPGGSAWAGNEIPRDEGVCELHGSEWGYVICVLRGSQWV